MEVKSPQQGDIKYISADSELNRSSTMAAHPTIKCDAEWIVTSLSPSWQKDILLLDTAAATDAPSAASTISMDDSMSDSL